MSVDVSTELAHLERAYCAGCEIGRCEMHCRHCGTDVSDPDVPTREIVDWMPITGASVLRAIFCYQCGARLVMPDGEGVIIE